MKTKGTVWLLGASSGLGLQTAKAFAGAGWLVVAGARSFADPQKTLERQETEGTQETEETQDIYTLPLDVTMEESCQGFVTKALAISPRVDVLCYAAGLLVLGACEETSAAEYQRVMDANFLGMTRMVGKALPLMRRQGHGKLILFSSLNGVVGVPFQSAYTASKHAIEGYAQCLAMEVRPFGVQVCLVQPGDHQSGSQAYRLQANQTTENSPYAQEYASACHTIHRDESGGLPAEALGRRVEREAGKKRMRPRLRVARLDQRAACWLHTLLPARLFFAAMRAYYVRRKGHNHTQNHPHNHIHQNGQKG